MVLRARLRGVSCEDIRSFVLPVPRLHAVHVTVQQHTCRWVLFPGWSVLAAAAAVTNPIAARIVRELLIGAAATGVAPSGDAALGDDVEDARRLVWALAADPLDAAAPARTLSVAVLPVVTRSAAHAAGPTDSCFVSFTAGRDGDARIFGPDAPSAWAAAAAAAVYPADAMLLWEVWTAKTHATSQWRAAGASPFLRGTGSLMSPESTWPGVPSEAPIAGTWLQRIDAAAPWTWLQELTAQVGGDGALIAELVSGLATPRAFNRMGRMLPVGALICKDVEGGPREHGIVLGSITPAGAPAAPLPGGTFNVIRVADLRDPLAGLLDARCVHTQTLWTGAVEDVPSGWTPATAGPNKIASLSRLVRAGMPVGTDATAHVYPTRIVTNASFVQRACPAGTPVNVAPLTVVLAQCWAGLADRAMVEMMRVGVPTALTRAWAHRVWCKPVYVSTEQALCTLPAVITASNPHARTAPRPTALPDSDLRWAEALMGFGSAEASHVLSADEQHDEGVVTWPPPRATRGARRSVLAYVAAPAPLGAGAVRTHNAASEALAAWWAGVGELVPCARAPPPRAVAAGEGYQIVDPIHDDILARQTRYQRTRVVDCGARGRGLATTQVLAGGCEVLRFPVTLQASKDARGTRLEALGGTWTDAALDATTVTAESPSAWWLINHACVGVATLEMVRRVIAGVDYLVWRVRPGHWLDVGTELTCTFFGASAVGESRCLCMPGCRNRVPYGTAPPAVPPPLPDFNTAVIDALVAAKPFGLGHVLGATGAGSAALLAASRCAAIRDRFKDPAHPMRLVYFTEATDGASMREVFVRKEARDGALHDEQFAHTCLLELCGPLETLPRLDGVTHLVTDSTPACSAAAATPTMVAIAVLTSKRLRRTPPGWVVSGPPRALRRSVTFLVRGPPCPSLTFFELREDDPWGSIAVLCDGLSRELGSGEAEGRTLSWELNRGVAGADLLRFEGAPTLAWHPRLGLILAPDAAPVEAGVVLLKCEAMRMAPLDCPYPRWAVCDQNGDFWKTLPLELPLWRLARHACAGATLRVASHFGKRVAWVATRTIRPGAQLTTQWHAYGRGTARCTCVQGCPYLYTRDPAMIARAEHPRALKAALVPLRNLPQQVHLQTPEPVRQALLALFKADRAAGYAGRVRPWVVANYIKKLVGTAVVIVARDPAQWEPLLSAYDVAGCASYGYGALPRSAAFADATTALVVLDAAVTGLQRHTLWSALGDGHASLHVIVVLTPTGAVAPPPPRGYEAQRAARSDVLAPLEGVDLHVFTINAGTGTIASPWTSDTVAQRAPELPPHLLVAVADPETELSTYALAVPDDLKAHRPWVVATAPIAAGVVLLRDCVCKRQEATFDPGTAPRLRVWSGPGILATQPSDWLEFTQPHCVPNLTLVHVDDKALPACVHVSEGAPPAFWGCDIKTTRPLAVGEIFTWDARELEGAPRCFGPHSHAVPDAVECWVAAAPDAPALRAGRYDPCDCTPGCPCSALRDSDYQRPRVRSLADLDPDLAEWVVKERTKA